MTTYGLSDSLTTVLVELQTYVPEGGWEYVNTGGGCMAFEAFVRPDCYVLVTSAEGPLTDGDTIHDVLCAGGWMVGAYRRGSLDDGCYWPADGAAPITTVSALIDAARAALGVALQPEPVPEGAVRILVTLSVPEGVDPASVADDVLSTLDMTAHGFIGNPDEHPIHGCYVQSAEVQS